MHAHAQRPNGSRNSKLPRPNNKQRKVSLRLVHLQTPRSIFPYPNTRKATKLSNLSKGATVGFFFLSFCSCLKTKLSREFLGGKILTNTEDETGRNRVPVCAMCSVSVLSDPHSQLGLGELSLSHSADSASSVMGTRTRYSKQVQHAAKCTLP